MIDLFFYTSFLFFIFSQPTEANRMHNYNFQMGNSLRPQAYYTYRQNNPSYAKFPNHDEISGLILSGDESSLRQIYDQLSHGTNWETCEQKILYSNQIVGMMKVAMKKKGDARAYLNSVYHKTLTEINRLKAENQHLEKEGQKLGIFQLNQQLALTLLDLSQSVGLFQSVQKQLQPNQKQIQKYEQDIRELNDRMTAKRSIIEKNTVLLVDVEDTIGRLEQDLELLKVRRSILKQQITQNQNSVKQFEFKIEQVREKIEKVEQSSWQIHNRLDNIKKNSVNLKVDIEGLKNRADQYEQDALLLKVYQNKKKIQLYDKKIKQHAYLGQLLTVLRTNLPYFLEQNNKLYYQCYEASFSKQQRDDGWIYVVSGQDLPLFLMNVYGSRVSLPSSSSYLSQKFTLANIFSLQWQRSFGNPFTPQQLAQNNLYVKDDFSCLVDDGFFSANGIITNLYKNSMEVRTISGTYYELQIGACTRMEVNERLIGQGQTIYFKGKVVPYRDREINLFFVSCL